VPWFLLVLAIGSEVFGTVMLKASDGFSKWPPIVGVILGYALSFLFLGLALKDIGVGVAYAIWSGLGTIGIVIAGYFLFGEQLNTWGYVGISVIIAGVIILNVSGTH
jgi:small multidrug resistance pump